jgi:putative transposase
MNRAAHRETIFFGEDDYRSFLQAMIETAKHIAMRVLAFAVMPNHWHLLLWPVADEDLSRYMQRLTRMHAQWWRIAHRSVGHGAVYQGRYKAIPVQDDRHFLTVCRYVERNPLRARLVDRSRDWQWGSVWVDQGAVDRPAMAEWPVPRPADWLDVIDEQEPGAVLIDLRERIRRGIPFGTLAWTVETAARLDLTPRLAGRGRPLFAGDGNN